MHHTKNKFDPGILVAFIMLFVAILLVFMPWNALHGLSIGKYYLDLKDYGQIGTFVGGVSAPLLSLAAFILLFKTYRSQQHELDETRKILVKQKFETTFFNLLNAHDGLIQSLTYHDKKFPVRGRDVFVYVVNQMREQMNSSVENREDLTDIHHNIYESVDAVEVYIESLDMLMNFLKREELGAEDFEFYRKVILSHVDYNERTFLQYHLKLSVPNAHVKEKQNIRILLKRSGTISLNDNHDFILDPEISRHGPEDVEVE